MKELSYHILDIANNSVRGKANEIKISVDENLNDNILTIVIEDNGIGIPEKILKDIKNPFTTTRTLRKVGLGIPLLEDTCNFCNGKLDIKSEVGKGTKVICYMEYNHIDRPPMGNLVSTIVTLITSEADINIKFRYTYNSDFFEISTNDIKEVIEDVPLNNTEIFIWLKKYLEENIEVLKNNVNK